MENMQDGDDSIERVPVALYRDFLTLVVGVERLKAKFADMKAQERSVTKKRSNRTRQKSDR